jgi:hypothetical protein
MRKNLLLIALLIGALLNANAQRQCGTMENLDRLLSLHPELRSEMEKIELQTKDYIVNGDDRVATVYNIPVVVHVVYNTTAQNISDAQIQSQINVLNKDFRRTNTDASNTPSAFQSVAADVEINFCLATRDPNGNATNGITRTYTSTTAFSQNDYVKSSSTGGKNPWPTGSYLNIWVCNLSGGLLGYAQFPGGPAATDGVVIGYQYFGTTGTAVAPFNKGRTGTHEVGHWLNLRHIWGDANCGSDYVTDTPTQQTSNYGCPSYPKPSCSNSSDMFMNYMDYTDDACMNLFTTGQKTRMRALFASSGARVSLLSSSGCTAPSSSTPTTTTYTIGTGTANTGTAPYGTYYMDERSQFIITKAELQAAGWTSTNNTLKSLAFNVYQSAGQTMNNFTIKIRHTTASSYSSTSFLSTSNMVTVFTGSVTPAVGWNTHNFTTNFTYNGTDNLLVDICWNNSSYTNDTKVYYTSTSAYRSLYYKADIASGGVCANSTGTQTYNRPNMKLAFLSSTPAKMSAVEEEELIADETDIRFDLYPNPATSNFTVAYTIRTESANVVIHIFDMMGKEIARVHNGVQEEGEHAISVDAGLLGKTLAPGIYLCTLSIDGNLHTKRFIIN